MGNFEINGKCEICDRETFYDGVGYGFNRCIFHCDKSDEAKWGNPDSEDVKRFWRAIREQIKDDMANNREQHIFQQYRFPVFEIHSKEAQKLDENDPKSIYYTEEDKNFWSTDSDGKALLKFTIKVDFENSVFNKADFYRAIFGNKTWFYKATFGNETRFDKATFGNETKFYRATFGDETRFDEATFGNETRFDKTTFGNKTKFSEATFGNKTKFSEATFGNETKFDKATFGNETWFYGATFGNKTWFYVAIFGDETKFNEATFGNETWFNQATFGNETGFDKATFGNETGFNQATFGNKTWFYRATFGDETRFDKATFGNKTWFYGATFESVNISLRRQDNGKEQSLESISFEGCEINKEFTLRDSGFLTIAFDNMKIGDKAFFFVNSVKCEGLQITNLKSKAANIKFTDVKVENALQIGNSMFDKTEFNGFYLASTKEIALNNTSFIGSHLTKVEWGKINEDRLKIDRQTARQLKYINDAQGETVIANDFYALEMRLRSKELKWKWGQIGEKLVQNIHGIVSNHSNDWVLPAIWFFVVGFLFCVGLTDGVLGLLILPIVVLACFTLVIVAEDLDDKLLLFSALCALFWSSYLFMQTGIGFDFFAKMVNPLNIKFDGDTPKNISLIYLCRLIEVFIGYQIITAIRKNTRRK